MGNKAPNYMPPDVYIAQVRRLLQENEQENENLTQSMQGAVTEVGGVVAEDDVYKRAWLAEKIDKFVKGRQKITKDWTALLTALRAFPRGNSPNPEPQLTYMPPRRLRVPRSLSQAREAEYLPPEK